MAVLTFAKDGSFLINIKLPGGGVPEIVPDWHNYDSEIETKKAVLVFKVTMAIYFLEETIKR